MTINTCTPKWCFKFIDVQKSKKLKLKLQKNRLKNYYKDQILSILQLQELQIINHNTVMHIAIAGNIGSGKQL
jgi:hypothetical protein